MTLKGKQSKTEKWINSRLDYYGKDPDIKHYLLNPVNGMTAVVYQSTSGWIVSPYNSDGSWTEDKLGVLTKSLAVELCNELGFRIIEEFP